MDDQNKPQELMNGRQCCPRAILFALLGYVLVMSGSSYFAIKYQDPMYLLVVVGYGILTTILIVRVCRAQPDQWTEEFAMDNDQVPPEMS